jgi:uncharacterized Ntn-hydrolase superfamily protein
MNQIRLLRHPLVSTFSIVAFDLSTKDLGVAVQSRYFSVGSVVPWAEAEVGAVATQSFVNVSYGPHGLQLLKEGLAVDEVIDRLTQEDKEKEYRQLGIIDSEGNANAFTGKKCLEWAGSKVGKNYAAQGNILAGEEVIQNMGRNFESTRGDLAERLVAALEGGEAAGGDARGRQSAALLVVRKNLGRAGYGDRYIDLRVEDNPDPIAELKRLLNLHRVYSLIDDSEDSLTKGDLKAALGDLKKAIAMTQKNDDVYVDLGIVNLKLGKKKEAISAFKKALRLNPKMKTLIKQLPAAGLMKSNKEIFVELGIL